MSRAYGPGFCLWAISVFFLLGVSSVAWAIDVPTVGTCSGSDTCLSIQNTHTGSDFYPTGIASTVAQGTAIFGWSQGPGKAGYFQGSNGATGLEATPTTTSHHRSHMSPTEGARLPTAGPTCQPKHAAACSLRRHDMCAMFSADSTSVLRRRRARTLCTRRRRANEFKCVFRSLLLLQQRIALSRQFN